MRIHFTIAGVAAAVHILQFALRKAPAGQDYLLSKARVVCVALFRTVRREGEGDAEFDLGLPLVKESDLEAAAQLDTELHGNEYAGGF